MISKQLNTVSVSALKNPYWSIPNEDSTRRNGNKTNSCEAALMETLRPIETID